MNRRQKIIISITGIVLVLLILVGLTYAYFLTRIQGNTNTRSISVTTADLRLVYGDGNGIITGDRIIPGTRVDSKTFTVSNAGNASVEYGVFLEDLVNNFERTEDLSLTVTCESNITGHTCDGYSGTMPAENSMLLTNTIDAASTGVDAEVHTYSLTLEYVETNTDQSVDMNKELSAKVNIYGLIDTVDLSGTISDATTGDYVVVNSDPKVSQIKSGTFKVVGLEPGTHTINVYHSDDTPSYSKTITINKGASEAISGTTATIVDETRTINTTMSSSTLTLSSLKKYYTIKSGTFAYQIIENAKNATSEQITNLYAEYSPTPKTTPAAQVSGVSESTLSITPDDYGTSYYFRGNVANNYVNFAGMCWRIVRIEGDGSVKLLLEDSTYECNNVSYDGNWTIGNTVAFGYDEDNKADFLGYTGGLADALKTYQTTLNTKIGTKYTSKGLSDYLKVDEWCYDHNVTEYKYFDEMDDEVSDPNEADYTNEYYGAYTRISENKQPSNVCTGIKISKYGDNTTDMYVGTLTADEIAFAGGTEETNTNYYIMNTYSFSSYKAWAPLSPRHWFGSISFDVVFFVYSGGGLSRSGASDDSVYVARPAVTLVSSTEAVSSGNGTISNPYVIS